MLFLSQQENLCVQPETTENNNFHILGMPETNHLYNQVGGPDSTRWNRPRRQELLYRRTEQTALQPAASASQVCLRQSFIVGRSLSSEPFSYLCLTLAVFASA